MMTIAMADDREAPSGLERSQRRWDLWERLIRVAKAADVVSNVVVGDS